MAGQFRSSQWDPVLIIAQIVAMQCLFYVGLGSCVALIDFILGYNRSLRHLFLYQVNYTGHMARYSCLLFLYQVNYTRHMACYSCNNCLSQFLLSSLCM